MSSSRSRGIILSRKLSGEADIICSILTKESGKNLFIFKGLKKSKKRPLSAVEPGTVIDFLFYSREGTQIRTVSEFSIVSSPTEIKKSTSKIFALCYIIEITDKTTGWDYRDLHLYNLLASAIDSLSEAGEEIHFTLFFLIRHLSILGILPGDRKCSCCGEKDFQFYSMSSNFSLSCNKCSSRAFLSGRSLHFLNSAMHNKYSFINSAEYNLSELTPLLEALTEFTESYFSINIKSKEMFLSIPRNKRNCQTAEAGLLV